MAGIGVIFFIETPFSCSICDVISSSASLLATVGGFLSCLFDQVIGFTFVLEEYSGLFLLQLQHQMTSPPATNIWTVLESQPEISL